MDERSGNLRLARRRELVIDGGDFAFPDAGQNDLENENKTIHPTQSLAIARTSTQAMLALVVCCYCMAFRLPPRMRLTKPAPSCGQEVSVSGEFAHSKYDASMTIEGADNNAAAFREEIYGENFTVTIAHLPAGKYTISIGEAETWASAPGERIFSVTSGDTTLAKNFDIIAAAGGARKVCYITGAVEHEDDSLKGPLTVSFSASKDNAKFNTFEVKNASGAPVVSFSASEMADALFRRRHAHPGNQRTADLA